jgi:hypothetical protein
MESDRYWQQYTGQSSRPTSIIRSRLPFLTVVGSYSEPQSWYKITQLLPYAWFYPTMRQPSACQPADSQGILVLGSFLIMHDRGGQS